jgi:hypothetical protein
MPLKKLFLALLGGGDYIGGREFVVPPYRRVRDSSDEEE